MPESSVFQYAQVTPIVRPSVPQPFDPSAYGPTVADLLAPERLAPLGPGVPNAAKDDLQIILHETQRTKDLVQDLLSFARQRPVKRELVNLAALLKQTTKLRSYDLQSHGVDVREQVRREGLDALRDLDLHRYGSSSVT